VSGTELTVVVPTHNRADLLDDTLRALTGQRWDDGAWDIVVVDNASTDRTAAVARGWIDRSPVPLTVVAATAGTGPAYARNEGVRHSDAPHLAFVDDDDVVGDGWVAAIGTALRHHAFVSSSRDYARLNPPEVADANEAFARELSRVGDTPVVTGGGLGCHRTLWERLGGMNEALRWGEDTDFSIRAVDAGTTPVLIPDAVYHFRVRPGVRSAFDRGRSLGRSSVDLYVRHGRDRGVRPDPVGLLTRVCAGYVLRLPRLRHRGERLTYAEQLGRRAGRMQRSLQIRVWYP